MRDFFLLVFFRHFNFRLELHFFLFTNLQKVPLIQFCSKWRLHRCTYILSFYLWLTYENSWMVDYLENNENFTKKGSVLDFEKYRVFHLKICLLKLSFWNEALKIVALSKANFQRNHSEYNQGVHVSNFDPLKIMPNGHPAYTSRNAS